MIRIPLVGHPILTFRPALDGVRGAPAAHIFMLNNPGPAEERGQLVELLPFPRLGLGIMALGALNLHAEEDATRGGGDLGRVAEHPRKVVDRGALVVDAGRRDQSCDNFVPTAIPPKLVGPPTVEELPADVVAARRSVIQNGIAPITTPVDRVVVALEQPVNESRSLVRPGFGDKALRLSGLRQSAGKVERGPSKERFVIHEGRQCLARWQLLQRCINLGGRIAFRRSRSRVCGQATSCGKNESERSQQYRTPAISPADFHYPHPPGRQDLAAVEGIW